MNKNSGTSLLEVLISMSLFSFFALQTLAFCLKLHNLTRQSLYDTQNVVIAESETHAAVPKTS
jgi:Tfp pilus assembly protein PilV